ncbi:MAG: hypothetical protein EPN40_05470 [Rhodanobacteraceae bacterium]|nr:MAG: hypothetical protein EPN40_05470 [Rhodanobacteraceae bacterium]
MPTLHTIRRLQHRHAMVVRGALLCLLAIMTFASMPKWVTHSHDSAHETIPTLAVDAPVDHHLDNANAPATSFPDAPHPHMHYLAGVAATLPATFADLCQLAIPGGTCPLGRDASASDGPLTPLHRPPIV